MSDRVIVGVFGISGVGKSSLIGKALALTSGWTHLEASKLIKEGKLNPELSSEALRTSSGDEILANQNLFIGQLRVSLQASATKFVVDGHLIIDTDQRIIEIPYDVVEAISPNIMLHVEDDPDAILARRASDGARLRPHRSAATLSEQQAHSRALCQSYGLRLAVPVRIIGSGDVRGMEAELVSRSREYL